MAEETVERERLILERILSLKQFIQDGVGGPQELHELGICYFHLDNFQNAARYLGQLIEEYADYVEIASVASLQIFCLIQEKEIGQALALLKNRLEKYPGDTRLLGMHAHCLQQSGKHQASIQTHRRIMDLDPENRNSLNSLGYLLVLHGRPEDQKEAMACITRALKSDPTNPAYMDSLGMMYMESGDFDRASRALQQALGRLPDNQEIVEHLQELMDRKKKLRKNQS